ncbi:MAG: hypothetical protein WC341_10955 [Bacteroidales bacterium]|jgi:hypothetical protein
MNTIYQIWHDEATKAMLDPLAIPAYNPVCTDYFENDVLISLHKHGHLHGKLTGVLSPRFKEKTGCSFKEVFQMIEDKPASIYILCSYDHPVCEKFWEKTYIGSIQLKDIINHEKILPFRIDQQTWVNAYCNYVICQPEIMAQYIEKILIPVKNFLQNSNNPEVVKILSTPVKHRGGYTSMIPYFLEGLWGSFIGNNPYKYEILIKPKPIFV